MFAQHGEERQPGRRLQLQPATAVPAQDQEGVLGLRGPAGVHENPWWTRLRKDLPEFIEGILLSPVQRIVELIEKLSMTHSTIDFQVFTYPPGGRVHVVDVNPGLPGVPYHLQRQGKQFETVRRERA
ncbi:hypothetical protein ACFVZC_32195 [Streptomyces marokkonensis]|uniref:ATP-grasp domain-containing protein n=1 Tax=Streptomyces marokkonensis TaxID=324855 RepID=A0ABW6QFK2_9ACTN